MNQTVFFPLKPNKIAIILNGQRNASQFLSQSICQYHHVIVCDGAWNDFSQKYTRVLTDLSITTLGDGDSITEDNSAFLMISDQETTDFEKAISHILSLQNDLSFPIMIDVFQAGGNEMDHALGNLCVAAKFSQKISCRFISDTQCYQLINSGFVEIEGANGAICSVLPFPKVTICQMTGFDYKLNQQVLSLPTSYSLRNRINQNKASINCHSGCYCLFIGID